MAQICAIVSIITITLGEDYLPELMAIAIQTI